MTKNPLKIKESEVVRACTDLLKIKHIIHFRNNCLNGKFQGYGEKSWRHVISGIKGISDWGLMLNDGSGRTLYLEIKRPGEKQSQDQKDFQADCDRRNVPYFCIDNVNDLVEILEMFGM